jgi:predicted Fe-Mo cluster-binding NifX family protein
MKIAFAYWENRIAPVFDTARYVLVLELVDNRTISNRQEFLLEEQPLHKILQLQNMGVEVLVCGAVSRPVCEMIIDQGIKVFSFVAGELQMIVQAWLQGEIEHEKFAMPGCRGRRRMRCRQRRMKCQEETEEDL